MLGQEGSSDSEIVNETKIQGTTDASKAGSLGINDQWPLSTEGM